MKRAPGHCTLSGCRICGAKGSLSKSARAKVVEKKTSPSPRGESWIAELVKAHTTMLDRLEFGLGWDATEFRATVGRYNIVVSELDDHTLRLLKLTEQERWHYQVWYGHGQKGERLTGRCNSEDEAKAKCVAYLRKHMRRAK